MPAKAIRDEILDTKAALLQANVAVIRLVNLLDNEAERLLIPAIDEQDKSPRVRKVKYTEAKALEQTDLELPDERKPSVKNPGPKPKRACSICRKPGHRAKNCPNAV